MSPHPEICTQRLRITPFTETHISEAYIGWLNNKKLMAHSEQRHREHDAASCLAYLRSFEKTPHYFWAIMEEKRGLGHIGNINAYVNIPNGLADMGILIGSPEAKGKGYGLETWKAVADFLLHRAGLRKVTAGTLAGNRAMLKLMEKAGMVEDGIRKRHYICNGMETDVVHMALFQEPKATCKAENQA
ncbi:GNAT family N-acetyltransferase [Desulfobotulus mexicanus]|uniref:GNAT family N-acetyltransferase n=1 Tax=Desulfobotulus mexicanus TaxID=2586642 RepID=A0A5Q4VJ69_9BACT|nr:GNAT family protein [Desulfobotulus mexicanus]TYT76302.1 GNAT family N-acetyltransferase [Desulfobotulus mexicanus]